MHCMCCSKLPGGTRQRAQSQSQCHAISIHLLTALQDTLWIGVRRFEVAHPELKDDLPKVCLADQVSADVLREAYQIVRTDFTENGKIVRTT